MKMFPIIALITAVGVVLVYFYAGLSQNWLYIAIVIKAAIDITAFFVLWKAAAARKKPDGSR